MPLSKFEKEPTNWCIECGRGYWVKPYLRTKTRFCSYACGGAYRARETLNTGTKTYMIGNKFRVGLRPTNAFRSEDVRGAANDNWKEGKRLICEHCASVFHQKPWLERQNGTARFCSRECFESSECFVGDKSPTYVGGVKTYRGRNWRKIRLIVVAEQEGNCAECGKHVGAALPIHHIRPFREFDSADEANVRSNLIGLCQSCHMKAEPRPRTAINDNAAPAQAGAAGRGA